MLCKFSRKMKWICFGFMVNYYSVKMDALALQFFAIHVDDLFEKHGPLIVFCGFLFFCGTSFNNIGKVHVIKNMLRFRAFWSSRIYLFVLTFQIRMILHQIFLKTFNVISHLCLQHISNY